MDVIILAGQPPTIAYIPTPLNSMAAICKALGVGCATVKQWAKEGAPIAVEGEGTTTRYSAELARLLLWREHRHSAGYTVTECSGSE